MFITKLMAPLEYLRSVGTVTLSSAATCMEFSIYGPVINLLQASSMFLVRLVSHLVSCSLTFSTLKLSQAKLTVCRSQGSLAKFCFAFLVHLANPAATAAFPMMDFLRLLTPALVVLTRILTGVEEGAWTIPPSPAVFSLCWVTLISPRWSHAPDSLMVTSLWMSPGGTE